MRINNKSVAISVLIALFMMLGGLSVYVVVHDNGADTPLVLAQSQFKDPVTSVSFSYPSDLTLEELTQADIEDNFVARLTSQDPPIIVSVRYEDGIEAIANITGQDTLELVIGNALKALPTRFPGFVLLSEQETNVANKEAYEITFSYDGPSGERATQRLVLFAADNDQAIYVSMQTAERDYEQTNDNIFSVIVDSLKL